MPPFTPTWKNVAAPNFGSTIVGLNQASQQITDSFGQLGSVFDDYAKRRTNLATNDAIKNLMTASPEERQDLLSSYDADSWVDSTKIFDVNRTLESDERAAAAELRAVAKEDRIIKDELEAENTDTALMEQFPEYFKGIEPGTDVNAAALINAGQSAKTHEQSVLKNNIAIAEKQHESAVASWESQRDLALYAGVDMAQWTAKNPRPSLSYGSAASAPGAGTNPFAVAAAGSSSGSPVGGPQTQAQAKQGSTPVQQEAVAGEPGIYAQQAEAELRAIAAQDPTEAAMLSEQVYAAAEEKDARMSQADEAVKLYENTKYMKDAFMKTNAKNKALSALMDSPLLDVPEGPASGQKTYQAFNDFKSRYGHLIDDKDLERIQHKMATKAGVDVSALDSAEAAQKADIPRATEAIDDHFDKTFADLPEQMDAANIDLQNTLALPELEIMEDDGTLNPQVAASYNKLDQNVRQFYTEMEQMMDQHGVPPSERSKIMDNLIKNKGMQAQIDQYNKLDQDITDRRTAFQAKLDTEVKDSISNLSSIQQKHKTGTPAYEKFVGGEGQKVSAGHLNDVRAAIKREFKTPPPDWLIDHIITEYGIVTDPLGPGKGIGLAQNPKVHGEAAAASFAMIIQEEAQYLNGKTNKQNDSLNGWVVNYKKSEQIADEQRFKREAEQAQIEAENKTVEEPASTPQPQPSVYQPSPVDTQISRESPVGNVFKEYGESVPEEKKKKMKKDRAERNRKSFLKGRPY